MVHGDFNYQAVGSDGSVAVATNTYEKFRVGYTDGGGVTFAYPGSPVGITIEYLYTNLGTVDQTILATSPGSSSTGVATTSMKTQSDAIRVKFSMGL